MGYMSHRRDERLRVSFSSMMTRVDEGLVQHMILQCTSSLQVVVSGRALTVPTMDRQGDGAGPGPSSLAQANLLSQRRGTSLLPQRWQALQAQLEGKDVELPKSGAHITLNDLIKWVSW